MFPRLNPHWKSRAFLLTLLWGTGCDKAGEDDIDLKLNGGSQTSNFPNIGSIAVSGSEDLTFRGTGTAVDVTPLFAEELPLFRERHVVLTGAHVSWRYEEEPVQTTSLRFVPGPHPYERRESAAQEICYVFEHPGYFPDVDVKDRHYLSVDTPYDLAVVVLKDALAEDIQPAALPGELASPCDQGGAPCDLMVVANGTRQDDRSIGFTYWDKVAGLEVRSSTPPLLRGRMPASAGIAGGDSGSALMPLHRNAVLGINVAIDPDSSARNNAFFSVALDEGRVDWIKGALSSIQNPLLFRYRCHPSLPFLQRLIDKGVVGEIEVLVESPATETTANHPVLLEWLVRAFGKSIEEWEALYNDTPARDRPEIFRLAQMLVKGLQLPLENYVYPQGHARAGQTDAELLIQQVFGSTMFRDFPEEVRRNIAIAVDQHLLPTDGVGADIRTPTGGLKLGEAMVLIYQGMVAVGKAEAFTSRGILHTDAAMLPAGSAYLVYRPNR